MTITINCECGSESTINLKTWEEIKEMEEEDEELNNSTDKFDISKHHDGCITMGSFECKHCGKYNYL